MDHDRVDRVEARGRRYAREAFEPAPAPPRPVDTRTRWAGTDVSFGAAGRLACTALILLPLVLFLVRGSLWWMLLTLALAPFAWVWLRDTWRRT